MQGPSARQEYALGLLLVAGSAVAWSTAGLYARAVHVDVWTTLFWRCAFAALLLTCWCLRVAGRRLPTELRALGLSGLAVAACIAASTMCFIAAIAQTSIAAVLITQATAPFVAALLGWAWLKERLDLPVLVACTLAFAGVVVMVAGSLGDGSAVGAFLSILMTVAVGLAIVLVRRWRQVSMMPAVLVAFLLAAGASLPLATPLSVGSSDFVGLAMFGLTQTGLGWVLLTLGARFVPAAETALLGVLEVVLAPLWVWLAFDEVPSRATFVGGGLVLAAVLGHVSWELRQQARVRRREQAVRR